MAKKLALRIKKFDSDTELMRIIAAFFVIVIHCSGTRFMSEVICNAVSRFSVPVFIILSGYYMLVRKPEAKRIFQKSAKLFAMMIAWAGIYCVYNYVCGNIVISGIFDVFRYLLTEPVHLWYIYAAITLYIFTPVLYVFHENASEKDYLYALLLTFVFGSVVAVAVRTGVSPLLGTVVERMKVPYLLGFIFLYMLGGFFRRFGLPERRFCFCLYTVGLMSVGVAVIGALYLPKAGLSTDLVLSFFSPLAMIPAAAFFVFVKNCFSEKTQLSGKVRALIHNLSGCTLGVYFLHPLIIFILNTFELRFFSEAPVILVVERVFVTAALSWIITFVGKKIPLIKLLF